MAEKIDFPYRLEPESSNGTDEVMEGFSFTAQDTMVLLVVRSWDRCGIEGFRDSQSRLTSGHMRHKHKKDF